LICISTDEAFLRSTKCRLFSSSREVWPVENNTQCNSVPLERFVNPTFAGRRILWVNLNLKETLHRPDIRDTVNFDIKDDPSADTILSVLFTFFGVIFKHKTAI
jgi:hypothetical protein